MAFSTPPSLRATSPIAHSCAEEEYNTFLRSCFKFIPRQIETYVEADWSPRYAVNSGLLTKIKGFKMRDRDSIWPEHTRLQ